MPSVSQSHVTGFAHQGITVSDLERSIAYFEGVLGFRRRGRVRHIGSEIASASTGVEGARMDVAFLECPGLTLELLQYTAPEHRDVFRPRPCDVGSVHLAVYVSSIDAAVAASVAADWQFVGAVQEIGSAPGRMSRVAYVTGDDGILIELLELPEEETRR
jgi:catechol 2,3-dioxygenase-like lactoylglutathione lyase family enzyme